MSWPFGSIWVIWFLFTCQCESPVNKSLSPQVSISDSHTHTQHIFTHTLLFLLLFLESERRCQSQRCLPCRRWRRRRCVASRRVTLKCGYNKSLYFFRSQSAPHGAITRCQQQQQRQRQQQSEGTHQEYWMRWAERQAKFELRRAGHALMAAAVAAWDSPALLCARPTHTHTDTHAHL